MIVKHLYTKPLYFALSEVKFFLNLHCLVQIRYCILPPAALILFWDQVRSIHIVFGRHGSNHVEAWDFFFFFLASSLLTCKDNSFFCHFWSFLIPMRIMFSPCWSSCRWRLYISRVRPVDMNFSYALSSRKISRN